MATKCKFCNSTGYGSGCAHSPYGTIKPGLFKVHEHVPGEGKCVFCGSTNTGTGCAYSPHPNRAHQK